MKIQFRRETTFIEVLPSIAFGWFSQRALYVAWLFWNVIIDF